MLHHGVAGFVIGHLQALLRFPLLNRVFDAHGLLLPGLVAIAL